MLVQVLLVVVVGWFIFPYVKTAAEAVRDYFQGK